jgi:hypothetical protein
MCLPASMNMANQWLRLWHDMPTDPKWIVIAEKSGQPISMVLSVFLHILTNASQSPHRGTLHHWSDEDVAAALRTQPNAIELIRTHMNGKVLDGDRIKGWEARQPHREDGSAERAKAWREKKKSNKERNRTQPNATERQDKDTDKDKEVIEAKASPAYSTNFLELWVLYPKKEGKHDAFKAYNRAIKGGADHGIIIAAVRTFRDSVEREGTEKRYIPGAEKWLNGRRWEDETASGTGSNSAAGNADLFAPAEFGPRSVSSSRKRSKWDVEAELVAAEYRAEAQRERQGTAVAGSGESMPAPTAVREN